MTLIPTAATSYATANPSGSRKTLPNNIPGLTVVCWFGQDPYGQAGNQVKGGPTLIATGAGPTSNADNTATFNAGSVLAGLDTTIPRSALLGGYTLLFGSQTITGGSSAVASDGTTGEFYAAMNNNSTNVGPSPPNPGMIFNFNASGPSANSVVETGDQSEMGVYGYSWGGQGDAVNVYDFTNNLSGATVNTLTMVTNSNTLKFGFFQAGSVCNPIKLSVAMLIIGNTPDTPTIQSYGFALRSMLGLRGFADA